MDSLLTNDNDLLDMDDLFIKPVKKNKILMLSDHPLAPSGVGVQARFLIDGLIKTGKYSFRCLGGALKHMDYRTVKINDDFIIKPIDGFGTHDLIRSLLVSEKPDALLIFTDPRQFIWLWEIEDEIHQICPVSYWHVWDNDPFPEYNRPWYESTDLINCLSYKTYELVKPNFPEKTNYIPHAFPKDLYTEIDEQTRKTLMNQNFAGRTDWFKVLWVNRNATRKLPADLLDSWKAFLEKLEAKHGHRNALLIMHTEPGDPEGPNLLAVSELLGLQDNVWFSTEKLQFPQMNVLHNLADATINISKNEGFGLSTLISLQVGKPIVVLKTGGETRQVIDHRNGNVLGEGIEPIKRCLVGSQMVPYIYEDFAGTEETADALLKVFEYTPEKKEELKKQCKDYVEYEFNYDKMIEAWDQSLTKCINDFKTKPQKKWSVTPLEPHVSQTEDASLARSPERIEETKMAYDTQEAIKMKAYLEQNINSKENKTVKKTLTKNKSKKRTK